MDWNFNTYHVDHWIICHTLRGCVDWNHKVALRNSSEEVTPFVGVWIETFQGRFWDDTDMSHPSWVCGLKHINHSLHRLRSESHPSWVCGLKHILMSKRNPHNRHTLRGCVDWNKLSFAVLMIVQVTPFVGVWIETCRSRPKRDGLSGHTLRGCVDWNTFDLGIVAYAFVTPFVGVWIETIGSLSHY